MTTEELLKRVIALAEYVEDLDKRVRILEFNSGLTSRSRDPIMWTNDKPEPKPEPPPVDRSAQVLTSGKPVVSDEHKTINPATGQQTAYVVLTAAERAKGFVRPVRSSYTHMTCGSDTYMAREIAETLARDPGFYSGGFCHKCRGHFPLDQFVWKGTKEQVGS